MRKISNKFILGLGLTFGLAFTSCNSDDAFVYDTPQQFDVTQVAFAAVQSSDMQCAADLTITSDSEATVYYVVVPSTTAALDSETIFDDSSLTEEFADAGSSVVSVDNLTGGEEYTIYGITVNADGLRSSEVYTYSFVQGATEVMVDSTYSGVSSIDGAAVSSFTATLTLVSGNTYDIDSAWGVNFVGDASGDAANNGTFVYPGTLTINADYSVTVTGDEFYTTGSTAGVYNPCTNELTFTLSQALFGDPFTVDVVLTPDNI